MFDGEIWDRDITSLNSLACGSIFKPVVPSNTSRISCKSYEMTFDKSTKIGIPNQIRYLEWQSREFWYSTYPNEFSIIDDYNHISYLKNPYRAVITKHQTKYFKGLRFLLKFIKLGTCKLTVKDVRDRNNVYQSKLEYKTSQWAHTNKILQDALKHFNANKMFKVPNSWAYIRCAANYFAYSFLACY